MRPTTITKIYLYNSRGRLLKTFTSFVELAEWSGVDIKTLRNAKDRFCYVTCEKHNINFYVQVSDTFTKPPKINAPKRRVEASFIAGNEVTKKTFASALKAGLHFGASLQYIHFLARTNNPLKKYQGLEVYFKFLD